MLDPDIKSLQIFPYQHDIHVLEPAARDEAARRPDVGKELEFLSQSDVHRSKPGADGCRQRTLESQRILPDAVDGGVRKRGSGGVHGSHAGELLIPVEAESGGSQHLHGLRGDLRPDTVPWNQGDIVRHVPPDGSTAASAAFNAWSGVLPRPSASERHMTFPVRASATTRVSSARIWPSGSGPKPSAAGTSARRPSAIASRLRRLERSGSGMFSSLGARSIACPMSSGSGTKPAARRDIFLSAGGRIQ